MEERRESVIKIIRCCLTSTQGSLDMRTLKRDYQNLSGDQIPYQKLGYKTLDDFILSVDTLKTSRNASGQLLVDTKLSKETSHLAEMVSRQKSSKKKTKLPTVKPTWNKRRQHNVKPDTQNWMPKNHSMRLNNSYQKSERPAAVSHNQFVSHKSDRVHNSPRKVREENKENVVDRKSVEVEGDFSKSRKAQIVSLPAFKVQKELVQLQKVSQEAYDAHSKVWDFSSNRDESLTRKVVAKTEFVKTGDPLTDLKTFIKTFGLPEMTIKITERLLKKKNKIYDCRITIGKDTYSSYPSEYTDQSRAVSHAASEALSDLEKQQSRAAPTLVSTERDVLERLPPMVEKHRNGVWNAQLEADYADRYGEQLPTNWLEIVGTCESIYIETLIENRSILKYYQPGQLLQKDNRMRGNPMLDSVSVPDNTVRFESDGTLKALIMSVVTPGEIWCRQIYTPEASAFESLDRQMNDDYTANSHKLRVDDVSKGGYYVARYDEQWVRVRVLQVDGDDVSCFAIDCGEELETTKRNVYKLKREYAFEQGQAFVCRLAGLEELYDVPQRDGGALCELVGKHVHVTIVDEASNPDDPVLPVVMIDLDNGCNLNKDLIEKVAMESALPVLQENTITQVFISHIEENGDIYIQLESPGFKNLQELLQQLKATILLDKSIKPTVITSKDIENNRLFLYEFNRVRINSVSPGDIYAQIYYVDHGKTSIVKCQMAFYALDELNDVAAQYPHQAVKVRLSEVSAPLPADFTDQLRALLPPDGGPVPIRVSGKKGEGGVPEVEVFTRTEKEEFLFSVNRALAMRNQRSDNTSKQSKLQRLISLNHISDASNAKNVPSAGFLQPPPFPAPGEYYEVNVPCAVNPWNFFVQPRQMKRELDRLMQRLQETYADVMHSPLTIDEIKPGRIYASRHEDGSWYRTSVIKVIHAGSISVFYCDFGYYANLNLQQLVPLGMEFMSLPYQALKAKLAGVKPKQQKWTMEDCRYFQKLVCKKPFMSLLTSTENDELYRSDKVFNLVLVDTTTDDDVYVHELLIEKGIAVADH